MKEDTGTRLGVSTPIRSFASIRPPFASIREFELMLANVNEWANEATGCVAGRGRIRNLSIHL